MAVEDDVLMPLAEACSAIILHPAYSPRATKAIQAVLEELIPYEDNFHSLVVRSSTSSTSLVQLLCTVRRASSLALLGSIKEKQGEDNASQENGSLNAAHLIKISIGFLPDYPDSLPIVHGQFVDSVVASQWCFPQDTVENPFGTNGELQLDKLEALADVEKPYSLLSILFAVKDLLDSFVRVFVASPISLEADSISSLAPLAPSPVALVKEAAALCFSRLQCKASVYLRLRSYCLPYIRQARRILRRRQSSQSILQRQEMALLAHLPPATAPPLAELASSLEKRLSIRASKSMPSSSLASLPFLRTFDKRFEQIMLLRARIQANDDVLRLLDRGLQEQHLLCEEYLKYVMHTARDSFMDSILLRRCEEAFLRDRNARPPPSDDVEAPSSSSSFVFTPSSYHEGFFSDIPFQAVLVDTPTLPEGGTDTFLEKSTGGQEKVSIPSEEMSWGSTGLDIDASPLARDDVQFEALRESISPPTPKNTEVGEAESDPATRSESDSAVPFLKEENPAEALQEVPQCEDPYCLFSTVGEEGEGEEPSDTAALHMEEDAEEHDVKASKGSLCSTPVASEEPLEGEVKLHILNEDNFPKESFTIQDPEDECEIREELEEITETLSELVLEEGSYQSSQENDDKDTLSEESEALAEELGGEVASEVEDDDPPPSNEDPVMAQIPTVVENSVANEEINRNFWSTLMKEFSEDNDNEERL